MQISFLCVAIIVALRAEVKMAGKTKDRERTAEPSPMQAEFDRLPALS
jgi:hypothetical protein